MRNKLLFIFMFLLILTSSVIFIACTEPNEAIDIRFSYDERIFYIDIGTRGSVRVENDKGHKIEYSTDRPDIIELENKNNAASITPKTIGIANVFAKIKGQVRAQTKIVVEPYNYTYLGDGSASNPYLIYGAAQLINMQNVEGGHHGKYFKLISDVVFKENEWERPIYRHESLEYNHAFKGEFDGNGNRIEQTKGVWASIFGINNGVIKNLNVYSNLIAEKASYAFSGVICDINNGIIENCLAEGIMYTEGWCDYVGGICGYNLGTISNCMSTVDIVGKSNNDELSRSIGGISGHAGSSEPLDEIKIINCIYLGSIKYIKPSEFENSFIAPYGKEIAEVVDYNPYGGILGERRSEDTVLRELYFDLNAIDGRAEEEKSIYSCPTAAVGMHLIGQSELSGTTNVTNVKGIADWSTVDFSNWNNSLWDFDGGTPRLKSFSE